MKILILITFLFSFFKITSAQFAPNNKEKIKLNRVNTISKYYFKDKSDSSLTETFTYDSIGNLINSKMFDKDGNISSIDTFIYDINHYLIKQLHFNNQHKGDIYTFRNDTNGKLLTEDYSGSDSTTLHNRCNRINNCIKCISYNGKGDTTFLNSLYNQQGLLIKFTSEDKLNGLTVVKFEYDTFGRTIKKSDINSTSQRFSKFKYDSSGNNYEIKTKMIYKNKVEIDENRLSHFPNGLLSESFLFINNKQILWDKMYYTYY